MRGAILRAAGDERVGRFVRTYGMQAGAARFVAGETVESFLNAAREANRRGFAVACGYLGEGVTAESDARAAAAQYCELLRTFASQGIDANVAFKLTQLGLDFDPELSYALAREITAVAADTGNTIRLDMEQSDFVDATLRTYRRLRSEFDCVGFVLQSYLYRSGRDLDDAIAGAPNIRFVKGAYLEPPNRAFQSKSDVDENYVALVERALAVPGYTAIATHDAAIVARIEQTIDRLELPKRGRFEFQMLYGIGTALAERLRDRGYRVRLAIPFGEYWFPYLMRRLAERPANVAFFAKGLVARG
ncbi:MAG TPA: proline dehydrogenase family protein [Candidatus Tumulicola sp.]|jgi:proline dehydrogenase